MALGEKAGIEMPIAAQVAKVLFEGQSAQAAVQELMERELKSEMVTA